MAKKTDFQIAAEYYAARLILSSLGILPRKLAVAAGLFIGDIGYLLLGKLRRIGLRNTEIAFPEMGGEDRKKLVRGCFRSLGRQLGEVSQFPKATKESLNDLVDFSLSDELWARYDQAKKEGSGVIFLTPHIGGWEIFALASSAILGPQNYLVRRLDNPRLEELTENLRGRFGSRPIDKRNSTLTALTVLREGKNLGILPDLNTQKREGIFVPFFGVPACTTAGVAALAMRTNSEVVTVSTVWDEQKNKYVVNIGRIVEFESSGDRKRDIKDFTAQFTEGIEELIRKNPDQWLWIHKRWKTRPDGEPGLY